MTAPGFELTSQRQKVSRLPTEPPGRPPRLQFNKYTLTHTHLKNTAIKRAMVRSRGGREGGATTFLEYLGVSQEGKMEGLLWRETLGRSLGLYDASELVSGMCHGNGCRQETTRLHAISCMKTG